VTPRSFSARTAFAVAVVLGLWWSWGGDGHERIPPAAATVSEPATVEPLLPSGRVEVPLLVGIDDSFARHVVTDARLLVGRVRLEPSPAPWGSVIGQSLVAGSVVREGTPVDLVLAQGSIPEPCSLQWCAAVSSEGSSVGARAFRGKTGGSAGLR